MIRKHDEYSIGFSQRAAEAIEAHETAVAENMADEALLLEFLRQPGAKVVTGAVRNAAERIIQRARKGEGR